MKIYPGGLSVCGSPGGVKVKLEHKSGQYCTTEPSGAFSAGGNVVWSGKTLGTIHRLHIYIYQYRYKNLKWGLCGNCLVNCCCTSEMLKLYVVTGSKM